MTTWHNVYITDCTGKKFFNTIVATHGLDEHLRDLTRHMKAIKSGIEGYESIDKSSVVLILDGAAYSDSD